VNFGRVNARIEKKLLKQLPMKLSVFPSVILLAGGQPPEVFPRGIPNAYKLQKWVESHYPQMSLVTAEGFGAFKERADPRIVVVGKRKEPSLILRNIAHKFQSVVEVAYMHKDDWADHGKAKVGPCTDTTAYLFTNDQLPDAKKVLAKDAARENVAELLEGVPAEPSQSIAEFLCKSKTSRRYCVLLIDADPTAVKSARDLVAAAKLKSAY
jgi:hypothetical protein